MTLKETNNFFESLKNEATNKSEIKIYNRFLQIISELKKRDFSKDEIQLIETELESLNLESNPKNRKKYFRKARNKFESYLKDKFSLTPKGYYTNYGIAIGLNFGVLFGIVLMSSWDRSLGISTGLSIGMIIGLLVGQWMDKKAVSEGRVL
ncbi:MAG: hypothetical protein C0595_09630 [Marinilabiliales bacterium]|nr:MAG: hypothetical protein C0595_09630 [Marinilabiliales bacterium]